MSTVTYAHAQYNMKGGQTGAVGVGFGTKGSQVRAPAGAQIVVALSKSHLPPA